jgi:6-hydroxycyclohex-1-ene-1-carbonyl-CoA dehydrogenase
MPLTAQAWFLEETGKPLVRKELVLDDPGPGEAIVEVEACGLCHTDLGFFAGHVPPARPLPLVLGHEVVGKVVAAGAPHEGLVGKPVVVPAVLPCGECAYCRAGRGNACPAQKFPGSDSHGGFSTHMSVPGGPLVDISNAPDSVDRENLSVVADATSTAYQAVRRSGLQEGDLAVVMGIGGVGGFVAQIAAALGATVIGCDVVPTRLDLMKEHGAKVTVNVKDRPFKEIRGEVKGVLKSEGKSPLQLKIFECSGTPQGQQTAFGLLAKASTLMIVGFTPKKVEVRLSNLMAHDATVHGTWACPPEAYPAVLDLIYRGKVVLEPFCEKAPMSRINELFDEMARGQLERRMVLDPKA